MWMLPNCLTLSRIALTPVICLLVALDVAWAGWAALAVWVYACVTDYLDGWLARRLGQTSSFGRFLDPIADKLIVSLTLLVLVGVGRLPDIHMLPVAVIIAREIGVSGLREHLAELNVGLPSSRLAKWKTATQMVAMGFLVVGPFGPAFAGVTTTAIGTLGLWVAAALAAVTGWQYLRAGFGHMAADSTG